jgi:hypothetical protein
VSVDEISNAGEAPSCRETHMECPHFNGVFMKYCVAEKEVYIPSIYEIREYCQFIQHRVCPHYMRTERYSEEMSNVQGDDVRMID